MIKVVYISNHLKVEIKKGGKNRSKQFHLKNSLLGALFLSAPKLLFSLLNVLFFISFTLLGHIKTTFIA